MVITIFLHSFIYSFKENFKSTSVEAIKIKDPFDFENIKNENDKIFWDTFTAQLIPCKKCRRTFFPHRLPVHEKSCKGKPINQSKIIKTIENTIKVKQKEELKSVKNQLLFR